MSTHLCKENCLGSYTTECSLAMFFGGPTKESLKHFYGIATFIEEARDNPDMFERRASVPESRGFLSSAQINLIEKLKVIALDRLHITVTDTLGRTFGSTSWGTSLTKTWDRTHGGLVQHLYFNTTIFIASVTDKMQQITFTCRDCLDKAIAEPLVPTLPRGVVAIVQGYL